MRHLSPNEIEVLNENESVARETRAHFARCGLCQQRVADAQRVERALTQLARVEPATDLAARILATLPLQTRAPNPMLGVATLLAALIGFALAYQTAFTLRANGAFELVSYYTTQPEIVTTYPSEAWSALAGAIPWMTMTIALAMLASALVLTYRWTSRAQTRATG